MDNLRISTITALSGFDTNIDLKSLYDNIEINDKIRFIQWGVDNTKGTTNKVNKRPRKNKKKKNVFYNQITLHYFVNKVINVKIFNNGKIQMTGLKGIEQGKGVVESIRNIIKKIDSKINDDDKIADNKNFVVNKYEIVLINSDFNIGYNINRDILHRHIIQMNIFSSYEPLIYPGVNIKYFYNSDYNDGICKCSNLCNGKGNSNGDGNCKRITIAVFKSGSIIITGANSINQLLESYNFINNLMITNKENFILK
tara:strand:+ start:136 stop:900 length:765 start_codon:yes stop_codon:yes gene_type:complete